MDDQGIRRSPRQTRYSGGQDGILDCCVAYNQYGGYCVPLSAIKRPAVQKILEGEVYEPDTIAFMREHGRGGDIVHAGTFFGDFLPAISHACDDESIVWALEPNPHSFRCAQATVAINGLSNIKLANAGLGSQREELPFQIFDQQGTSLGGLSQFVKGGNASRDDCVMASVVRMDDLIPPSRRVGIIQLDVEGYEEQSLMGAIETIRRCRPILILETEISEFWLRATLPGIVYRSMTKLHTNTVYFPAE
ncbi:MAG: FkbM family methyltransferase [Planctomycetota bacterium]